ncbi:MAG: hypothetical protein E7587_03445 [Ruminococcaceae bacterium]|nr:hypothetical protein [Oscillospiraceae bacterium]
MKREKAFFGVHFDFHAMEGQTVGEDFRPDIVAKMLDEVKPDFAQCDTKGHKGLSSYPTKVGTQADKIEHDVLRMWRDLTKERGIPLYGHHSGVYEQKVVEIHPDWAVVNENGEKSSDYVSVFSPYAEEYLIPQLKELALDYDLDGAWIDGDCWASHVDYSDYAQKAYKEKTGKNPPKSDDEDYIEYKKFCRDGFISYVTKYITEIKKVKPDFEITSNWLNSSQTPIEPKAPIDFISGDYTCTNAVESARYEGRCISCHNMPWDLMAWGQNARPGSWMTTNRSTKELSQYCQEAAQIIALGGGFQFFNIMYGFGGTVQEWMIPVWSEVAKFCREREKFCFRAKQIPQIAVIYPEMEEHAEHTALFGVNTFNSFKSLKGWINALQDIQISSSVLYEYQLNEEVLSKYKAIVIPDNYTLSEKSAEILENYVKNGGKLLLDSKANKLFEGISKLTLDYSGNTEIMFADARGALFAFEGEYPTYKNDGAMECAQLYFSNYYNGKPSPAAWISEYGKGQICTLAFSFGKTYSENISTAIKNFLKDRLDDLGFVPLVEVSGSSFADVVLTQKDGHLMINISNTSGSHNASAVRSYSEIPKIGPLTVTLHTDKKPRSVYAEPQHKKLKVSYSKSSQAALFTLDKLDIHTVIVVEK